MNLLHIYDHTYVRHQRELYSYGAFNVDSWTRYLDHFDKLTILSNLSERKDLDFSKMNKVERERVDFRFVQDHRSIGSYIRTILNPPKALLQEIEAHDAVVVRLPSELGYVAARLARAIKKPLAIEVVGCPWDAYINHGSVAGKFLAPISMRRMKWAVKDANYVIYVTEEYLQNSYPTRGFSMAASNVMLDSNISEGVLANRLERIRQFQNGGRLTLALVGSFDVRYKGHLEVLKALANCRKQIPEFILKLVGVGDHSWVLKTAQKLDLEDHIEIVGRLQTGPAIFNFLDTVDLYIHPSKQEGLPRSLIEAMSRGCPALASSVAGIPELLDTNYLHRPGDYTRLSEQITFVTGDDSELMKMAKVNFNRAKDYYPQILESKRLKFWQNFRNYAEAST